MRIKDVKNFKYWGKGCKRMFIADILRKIIWLTFGIGLYAVLNNTGLLIYIICNLWLRWYLEDQEL